MDTADPDRMIDEVARRRFEADWQHGRPAIESYLPPITDPHYRATLEELVLIDLELDWRRFRAGDGGPPLGIQEYVAWFPALGDATTLGRLIREEFLIRRRHGENPSTDEYRARFPQIASFDPGAETLPEGSALPTLPVVSGYQLIEEVGRGGMGVVWKARQMKLHRIVALKMVLGGHRAEHKDLIRFLAEAEAVAAVKHPHVVQVHEFGDADGCPFLAMEYLPGGSLADRLRQAGRFDPVAAATLVGTLAGAVQAAHDLGIVHRDLKPGNVLYDESGQAKVTDFGLAKRGGGSGLTATQAVMGSPAYMAPEQASGNSRFVGPGADIYSLGVILYECLTGARPFDDVDPILLLRRVAETDPEPPRKRVPGLPRDAEVICLKCLEKDPADRYPTAAALAADLARFAAGEPVSVRSAGMVERGYKWARRNPTRAAAYGLTLTVVILVAFGASLAALWRTAERAKETAEEARDREQQARSEAEQQREKVERFEYGRTIQVAYQECRENKFAAAMALLETTRPDLRGWEYRYLHRLCHADLLTLRGHTGAVHSAAFSADGSRVVTGSADGTAKVWDTKTGAELLTLTGHKHESQFRLLVVNSAVFSADGSRIVTASDDSTAKIWDTKTGTVTRTLTGHKGPVKATAFSPDGSRVVTGSEDGTAKLWDAKTGTEVFTFQAIEEKSKRERHDPGVHAVSFNLDGARVMTASYEATVVARFWDAKTGAQLPAMKALLPDFAQVGSFVSFSSDWSRLATNLGVSNVKDAKMDRPSLMFLHLHDLRTASFSLDGSRVVTGSSDHTAVVWDIPVKMTKAANRDDLPDFVDEHKKITLKGHTGPVRSVAFSPDGKRVVTGSDDGTAKVWDAARGTDQEIGHEWFGGVVSCHGASFSPDGTRVVSRSVFGTVHVWDASTGVDILKLGGHAKMTSSASFSRDGAQVLTAGEDGTVSVWDAQTGALVFTLQAHMGEDQIFGGTTAAFSPDRSRIVSGSGGTFGVGGDVKVWDVATRNQTLTLHGHTGPVHSAAFSADGSRVLTTSSDRTAKLWDANTGAEVLTLTDSYNINFASFSADGSRVVTASDDWTAKVWDAGTGALLITLAGHTDGVEWAEFSPEGKRVLTGSKDGTAKVWDVVSGAEVLTLKGDTNTVHIASFSPDGSRVLTGDAMGKLRVWNATPINREFLMWGPFAPVGGGGSRK